MISLRFSSDEICKSIFVNLAYTLKIERTLLHVTDILSTLHPLPCLYCYISNHCSCDSSLYGAVTFNEPPSIHRLLIGSFGKHNRLRDLNSLITFHPQHGERDHLSYPHFIPDYANIASFYIPFTPHLSHSSKN